MRVLIVGCGYVGLPLGVELVRQGHEVFGLRRSAAAEAELKRVGITPLLADITQPESLKNLPRHFDWVVNCAASGGADNYRNIYLEGNRNLVAWLGQSPPKKFIYTSKNFSVSTKIFDVGASGSVGLVSVTTEPSFCA